MVNYECPELKNCKSLCGPRCEPICDSNYRKCSTYIIKHEPELRKLICQTQTV